MAKKEKVVQRTFAKLDVDNSGYIDADELVGCCLSLHLRVAAGSPYPHSLQAQASASGAQMQVPLGHCCHTVWLISDLTGCRPGPCASCGCRSA